MKDQEYIVHLDEKRKRNEQFSNILIMFIAVIIVIVLIRTEDGTQKDSVILYSLFLAGIIFMFVFLKNLIRQIRIKKWTKTKCLIIEKKYEKKYGAILYGVSVKYMPLIYFSYEHCGHKYISEKLRLFPIYYGNEIKAKEKLSEFILQHRYDCYVNPSNPEIAILERKISWNSILFPLLYSIFLLVITIIDM